MKLEIKGNEAKPVITLEPECKEDSTFLSSWLDGFPRIGDGEVAFSLPETMSLSLKIGNSIKG